MTKSCSNQTIALPSKLKVLKGYLKYVDFSRYAAILKNCLSSKSKKLSIKLIIYHIAIVIYSQTVLKGYDFLALRGVDFINNALLTTILCIQCSKLKCCKMFPCTLLLMSITYLQNAKRIQ